MRTSMAALVTALALAGAAALPPVASAQAAACATQWPLWTDFQKRFIQPDGRVLDASTAQQHTSSEGQSYGMFFALVANDRATFERLWTWTRSNLAAGDIARHLPAWIWGRAPDGAWRVLDDNSASDADLWIAYDLLEAARLWARPDYAEQAQALLGEIEQQEVADLPGLGPMLLPGARGFALPGAIWRLNASYLPPPVLRRLAKARPKGPWDAIARNSVAVYRSGTNTGFVPDWVAYVGGSANRFATDPVKGDIGSYDAIRAYMWPAVTADEDTLAAPLRQATRGMPEAVAKTGVPPETVHTATGVYEGTGPFGFSAALLPALQRDRRADLLEKQKQRVLAALDDTRAKADASGVQPHYYDYVLTLFGLGWSEGRYRFAAAGGLQPSWEKTCDHASTP
jgi:endoglucanase